MLYIKTTTAARRMDRTDMETIAAEDVRLVPSVSEQRMFKLDWDDGGLFVRSDVTPEGRLCRYERYRRSFRKDLERDSDAQAAIARIRDAVKSGKDVVLTVKENRKFPNSVRRLLVELFHEAGIDRIETDRGIDAPSVRLMDVLTTSPMMNTRISYYNTDATGATATTSTVIAGAITDGQINRILASCKDGKWFCAEGNGMRLDRASEYDPEKDNTWAKFFDDGDESFQVVNAAPTADCTVEELVKSFEHCAPYWDTMADTTKLMIEGKI